VDHDRLATGRWLNAQLLASVVHGNPDNPDNVRMTTNMVALIENTVRYVGMDVEDALTLAEGTEI
jgi:hypothetical protein